MQKLIGKMRAAIERYHMISENDKIAVGISGGKDSLVLLCALAELKRYYPVSFELVGLTIDPCFHGVKTDYSKIEELCHRLEVPYRIKRTRLADIVFEERKEKNPCSLCAKMRRGILHNMAKEYGCTKIALGHHFDDAVETFFMNLFQCGTIGCFSAVSYLSRKDLYLIRPMIFCEEKEVAFVSTKYRLPVEKSSCPVDGKTERQRTKELIVRLEREYPHLRKKVFTCACGPADLRSARREGRSQ